MAPDSAPSVNTLGRVEEARKVLSYADHSDEAVAATDRLLGDLMSALAKEGDPPLSAPCPVRHCTQSKARWWPRLWHWASAAMAGHHAGWLLPAHPEKNA